MEADDGAGQRPSGSEPAGSVGGEVPGEELVYPVDRMLANARENFPQVCFGLEAIENGCADDGVERRSTLATSIGTGKKPILPADADAAKHILDGIVGDLQPAVLDVARQSFPPRACIADGLGQLAAPGNALELLIEPGCELLELGFGQLHSDLLANVRRLSRNGALDVKEHADLLERLLGNRRSTGVVNIEDATARMTPARNFGDRTRFGAFQSMEQLVKTRVAVGMKVASERCQMRPAVFALAVGRALVEHRGRPRPGAGPLMAKLGPEAAGLGRTAPGGQDLEGGLVGVDHVPRHDVLAKLRGQRLQQPCRLAVPVGEQRTIELDVVARIDLGLPIERDMIAVLGRSEEHTS